MTEIEIIKKLSRHIDDRKYPFQMANAFIYAWECDYWTLTKDGEAREYEIKISIADYLKDFKKDKHKQETGANYFYYVCPKDLIAKEIVDKRYGLIYISDNGVEIVKKPQQLHDNKFDNWQLLANKLYWRFRGLWREKYLKKEIDRQEYIEGFNLQLEEFENNHQ